MQSKYSLKEIQNLIYQQVTDPIATPSDQGLRVYAEGYFFRILECMQKDFPKTNQAMGEDQFSKSIVEYLKKHPSRVTAIDEIGSHFPLFLETYMPGSNWLADLAHLEWLQILAFYHASFDVIEWREQLTKADPALLTFQINPSLQLLQNKHDGKCFIIYHQSKNIHTEPIESTYFQIIKSLKEEKTLSQAIEASKDSELKDLSVHFSHWVETGILKGIK